MNRNTRELTEHEKLYLEEYGRTLNQYLDKGIREYSPIGWRKRPKIKMQRATEINDRKSKLERKLGLRRLEVGN